MLSFKLLDVEDCLNV